MNLLEYVKVDQVNTTLLTVLIVIGIILSILLVLASVYLISTLRRKSILIKKIDYLVEDLTYKSESLNPTIETINRLSNYMSSLDAVSKKGFKTAIKLLAENKNYIYSVTDKIRSDVRKNEAKKLKNIKAKKTEVKKDSNKKSTTSSKPKAKK